VYNIFYSLYYKINKNSKQKEEGKLSYEWTRNHMTILNKIRMKNLAKKPLSGYKIGLCLHVTKETAVLAMAIKDLGGQIVMCSANPLSIQDNIAAFLTSEGIDTFAKRGETQEEYRKYILAVLKFKPDIIIDDGGELHISAHKNKSRGIIGGAEETTSGVYRLKMLESKKQLKYPIVAVNNALTKHLFDNRYGTGQSTMDGIIRTTGLLMAGKQIVVCGYGWVGKGVAARARGLGGNVTITEVDPIKALEANMDGFNITQLIDIASTGDIFITCTGQTRVIAEKHIKRMKDGAILANAGHFDVEIDVNYLISEGRNPTEVRPYIDCFYMEGGKRLFLIAKGRVVNLVGADGHPPEVMALSFSNQLLSILFISRNHHTLESKIYDVPKEIDLEVANSALDALKIKIDKLTNIQRSYLGS